MNIYDLEIDRDNYNYETELSMFSLGEHYFDNIIKVIDSALIELGIKENIVVYKRNKDKKSFLGIKVKSGDINELSNYVFFGCNVDNQNFCDVYIHSDSKSAQLAIDITNLLTKHIVAFFETMERDLFESDLEDLELSLKIPLKKALKENNRFNLKSLVRRIFR